jgi:hypothetical protein
VRVDPLAKESNRNPAYDAGYDITLNRPRGSLDSVAGVVMARHPEEAVLPQATVRECLSTRPVGYPITSISSPRKLNALRMFSTIASRVTSSMSQEKGASHCLMEEG